MTVHHITYATKAFNQSVAELTESAAKFGVRTTVFRPDAPEIAPLRASSADIMAEEKGAGYWLWKPFLIATALKMAAEGDIVFYTDAGLRLISSPDPLFKIALDQDILLFHMSDTPLGHWTKRDAFVLTSSDRQEYWKANVVIAGYQVYRNGERARGFVNEWLAYCLDRRILTDDANTCGLPNREGFVAHRHDQSVLSIISHRHKVETWLDPSQFASRPVGYAYGQIFDLHRRRALPPLTALRARLQIRTRLKSLIGRQQ